MLFNGVRWFLVLGVLWGVWNAPRISEANPPTVGRKAAARYFNSEGHESQSSESHPSRRALLSLFIGSMTQSESYLWGGASERGVGRANYGFTYQFGESRGFNQNLRVEFQEFLISSQRPRKLAVLWLWTLPSVEHRFPIYFGGGIGGGIFFQQLDGESVVSFDYQLVAGVQFFDVFGSAGLFVEMAMKNHLHLASDGQFNGTSLVFGTLFSF